MKKTGFLLLALILLLCPAALGETALIGTVNSQPLYIALPDGYTAAMQESEFGAVALVTCEDETAPRYTVSIAYSEEFAGYTLDIDALTEEDRANMEAVLSPDFNLPQFTLFKTESGLSLLLADETDSQSEYAYLLTIYDGYFVEVDMVKSSPVTEEDVSMATLLLESISVEP